jgi:LacI family transcriptional regulator
MPPGKRNIAAAFELKWPYKRHYGLFAGLKDYACGREDWNVDISSFPEIVLARGGHFDGIIGRITSACAEAARKARIPAVNVWMDSPVGEKLPSVYPDFHEAGRMAAEHLIDRGFRRLAYFGFNQSAAAKCQHEGVREVADRHGHPVSRHLVSGYWDEKPDQWLRFEDAVIKAQAAWEGAVGVVCMTDELARAISSICQGCGWTIPEQLAFVGTGNDALICTAVDPSLSSIAMGYSRCGHEAARQLDKLMKGAKSVPGVTLCPPRELVLRRSSDVYAVNDLQIEKALRHMADHSGEPLSVDAIANAVGIGRRSFERRFQQQIGRSVNSELTRMRIAKLKRLLVENENSIAELAYETGFGNLVSMHDMFKRSTGMTPGQYRERHGPRP